MTKYYIGGAQVPEDVATEYMSLLQKKYNHKADGVKIVEADGGVSYFGDYTEPETPEQAAVRKTMESLLIWMFYILLGVIFFSILYGYWFMTR